MPTPWSQSRPQKFIGLLALIFPVLVSGGDLACDSGLAKQFVDETAVVLLLAIHESPCDPSPRFALARHYGESRQYSQTSKFFEASALLAAGEDWSLELESTEHVPFSCDIATRTDESQLNETVKAWVAVQRALADRLATMQPWDEGRVQAAAEAIKVHGVQCGLLAEWAGAVVLRATYVPSEVPIEMQEAALRLHVELAANNHQPISSVGMAAVLKRLGAYFAAQGDPLTAVMVEREALRLAGSGSFTGGTEKSSFEALVRQALAADLAALEELEGCRTALSAIQRQ